MTKTHLQHRRLEVFRAVLRSGSVTGASLLLGLSQPGMSKTLGTTDAVRIHPGDVAWIGDVVGGGVARRRTVVLSQRAETTAAVRQGREPGDTVILFPTDVVAEGVRVRPR
jgi:hypothetical protein